MSDTKPWSHFRTCSRVHGGPCSSCKKLTYFGYHVSPDRTLTLCRNCYKKQFEPEKHAKELAEIAEAKKRRDEIVADERQRRKDGRPPREGWERRDNWLVQKIKDPKPGAMYGRALIEIEPTLYDTEPFVPDPKVKAPLSFFQDFKKFTDGQRE